MTENITAISFDDFMKLDVRVAKVLRVEAIEGADKLWKLTLDVGALGERTICAGLKEFYSDEELLGKHILYLSNLAPRMMRGVESQGMLLAASSEDHKKVVLLDAGEAEPGWKVG